MPIGMVSAARLRSRARGVGVRVGATRRRANGRAVCRKDRQLAILRYETDHEEFPAPRRPCLAQEPHSRSAATRRERPDYNRFRSKGATISAPTG